jgi:hypothetical protein
VATQLENPSNIQALDNELKNQINSIYREISTNISDVDSLTERRHKLIIQLGGLYEQRVKLGTLVDDNGVRIKKHQICIKIHKDMTENNVLLASYPQIAKILPKKYKKPYQFHKIENDVDKDGKPTGNNAEITELNMEKGTLETYKTKIPNIEDYSVDGTYIRISEVQFNEACENIKKINKQLKNLSELQPAEISALALQFKENYNTVKRYCAAYSIKIPGEKKPSASSVSLNLEKPSYRKEMLHDEIRLLEKDLAVIRKGTDNMLMSEDEEYLFWEAVRAIRLYIRPHANQKYRRHWWAYNTFLKILQHKNMSGVAKNDTLSPGQIYDPETKKNIDIEDLMEDGVTGVKKLKGISRNHLRNMSYKITDVFSDFMLDMPFLQDLASNFEQHLQPIRDGRAIMMTKK